MNIITKYSPVRLAVYGFYKDNGGLPVALKMFTALLAANYHPSLTSTTSVNGIYSLTLVELPFNELDRFRTQQLADEESWGKPLTYFEFAKFNPRLAVEITADDYAYMLGVMPPPIVGKNCFAMGDLYSHTPAGEPIYYWACERGTRYFCLLGTQEEAEQEFAPTLISDAHATLMQQLIAREDNAGRPTRPLERLLKICQNTTVVLPSTASPNQLGQLCPPIVWTKPLTACGPDHDPNMKLHGTVNIDGVSFHAEAYEVCYSTDGEQIGKQDEEETYLGEICNIVQGAAETIAIASREYVLAITPGQR